MEKNTLNQLPAGTLVAGRYQILEVIGQGGFGITYRGYDPVLDMSVAIKEYFPSGIASRYYTTSLDVQVGGEENIRWFEKGKKDFLAEARILARFSEDPNVVSVRDFFEDNRTVYIVMQFLKGETLKDYSEKRGPMSFDEAFAMLRPVMRALSRIHATGLIHRDISPSNLMRTEDGTIKLIDFGTAREISSDGNKSLSVLLNPGYAPAEQYQTRGSQGPWTDVYALCASIYRLITGVIPENSLDRLLSDQLRRPSAYGARITSAQENALMHGLAVRDQDRIRDMGALEKAFAAASLISDENVETTVDYAAEQTVRGPSGTSVPAAERTHEIPASSDQKGTAGPRAETPPSRIPVTPAKKVRRTGTEKKKKKIPVLPFLRIFAVIILAAGIFRMMSSGTGGGKLSDWTNTSREQVQRITLQSSDRQKPVLTVTRAMLDEIDRNKKIQSVCFYSCEISDEMIKRLSSMKQIEQITFRGCTGFSTLAPLSGLQTLRGLDLDPYGSNNKEPVIDGAALFSSDIPQLTNFSLVGCQLKNGVGFLEHFPGAERVVLQHLDVAGTADVWPETPALKSIMINEVDLSNTDLSALGRTPLESLTITKAGLHSLSFLKTAGSLRMIDASDNQLTTADGLQAKEHLSSVTLDRNLITDISALAECPSLTLLRAEDNQIRDISALSSGSKIWTLDLDRNSVEDISALSGCGELSELYLADNQITGASALSGCPDLFALDLSGNKINDLSCLADCSSMKRMNISRTGIEGLVFCENMLQLQQLRASENRILTLDGLQNVTQLKDVRLDGNQISDVSLLSKNTEHLKLAVLDHNRITDLSPLEACVNLEGLSVNDNQLSTLTGLQNCTKLKFLSASGNQISDISSLGSCTSLYTADLGENQIRDVSALGASASTKMALLLQNNQIGDISPLYGMKDYACLSLYNNNVTDISGMSAMTGIKSGSLLYLDFWNDLVPEDLAKITYREPRLVQTPADRQVNLQNTFQQLRRDAGTSPGKIVYLTSAGADAEIGNYRTKARVSAGIEEKEQTQETSREPENEAYQTSDHENQIKLEPVTIPQN